MSGSAPGDPLILGSTDGRTSSHLLEEKLRSSRRHRHILQVDMDWPNLLSCSVLRRPPLNTNPILSDRMPRVFHFVH